MGSGRSLVMKTTRSSVVSIRHGLHAAQCKAAREVAVRELQRHSCGRTKGCRWRWRSGQERDGGYNSGVVRGCSILWRRTAPGGGGFGVTPETHSPGDGNVHGKRRRGVARGDLTGDAGVPWPATHHVDEQVGAQVAQRDAPVREQLAALALKRLHGGDEAQPHVAPEHRVAPIWVELRFSPICLSYPIIACACACGAADSCGSSTRNTV